MFIECDTGTSANAIASKIKVALSDLGLDLENVRGQVYDGASNMSGKYTGTARLSREESIHCFAHCLNLCVVASCTLQVVKIMNTVCCVSEYFFYPKSAEFLKSQVENFTPQQRHRTLLDVCRTRWTPALMVLIGLKKCSRSTCRKVFYLFIIASHIRTASGNWIYYKHIGTYI